METTSKFTVAAVRSENNQISKHIVLKLVLSFDVGSLDFLTLKIVKFF